MEILRTWHDFIIDPCRHDGLRSYTERVDVGRAVDTAQNGWDPRLHPKLVTIDEVERPDDAFEAMAFDLQGNVVIWTRLRVWYVRREDGVKERLRWMARHPDMIETILGTAI